MEFILLHMLGNMQQRGTFHCVSAVNDFFLSQLSDSPSEMIDVARMLFAGTWLEGRGAHHET
jgi:hypothetical protein